MTPTDPRAVAAIHLEAFQGFFLSSLGSSFLAYYYRCFPHEPGAIALVAEQGEEGRVVGFVVGTINPRAFYRRILRRHWLGFALRAAGALALHPGAAPRLLRGLTHSGGNPGGKAVAGLFSIAVLPAAHGGGSAAALMRGFLELAAARGARSAFLHTDAAKNERVNAFYRRHGFTVERTLTTPEGRQLNEYWRDLPEARSAAHGERWP